MNQPPENEHLPDDERSRTAPHDSTPLPPHDDALAAPLPFVVPEMQPLSPEEQSAVIPDKEPFAHAKYGFAAVVSIYLMYQFAGGALHSLARNHSVGFEIVLQGLGQILFMLIPALLIMRYSPLKTQGLMRSGGEVTVLQWALGLIGIFGIQIFDAGFIAVQERLTPSFMMPVYQQLRAWSDMVEQFYRTSFAGTTAWEAVRALIIGAVVPAFAEEVLFRGVLQRSLEEVYPLRRAVIVTAILFGILHFNPLSVIPLILIGAYLGFLAYYTQSLALPIVAHFLSNAIAIVALYAPSQGVEMSPYGISLGRGLLLLLLGALIFMSAYLLIRRLTPQMRVSFAS
jgi:membrane protease YdiL (CAAX protease family)